VSSPKMIAPRSSDNDGPLTWIGGFPLHVSTLLAGVHAATLVLTALALAAGAEAALQTFVFSSTAVVRELSLWQMATYAFVHMPPYWLFLIELYLLVVFGREIEGYLGRGAFVRFYLTLLLAPPLLFTAAEWLGWHTSYAGSSALHFGVFVAFALIYPTAEMFFGIQAKWIALALLAINSLQCLALSDYEALAVLAVDSVAACLFIARFQGRLSMELPSKRHRIPVHRAAPQRQRHTPVAAREEEDLHGSIDPILDKISRSGMASLTPREREHLEKARHKLIAKDGGA
ncbi:MAG: DUF6576 domain-containing protein, partial [Terrimicrobiaceae bacterium]